MHVVLLLTTATAQPRSAQAQGLLGTVTDSVGRALVGAEVTVLSDSLVARTGTDGRFAFRGLPVGTCYVRVRAIGSALAQERVVVPVGGSSDVRIVLRAVRPALEAVVAAVTVHQCPRTSLMGFAWRRDAGSAAYFVNVGDIERIKPTQLYDLLDGLPGIRRAPGRPSSTTIRARRFPWTIEPMWKHRDRKAAT